MSQLERRSLRSPRVYGEQPSLTRQPRRGERVAEFVLRLVALTSIASILLILVFVAREALPICTTPWSAKR